MSLRPLNLITLMVLIGLSGAMLSACKPKTNAVRTVSMDPHAIGGPFTLINQDAEIVTRESFLGKPQLIYFGFGFCPDVCPTSLQRMGAAMKELRADADKIQPIFITIDPERDTAESLKLYITANGFPENLIGLTGSQEQIDAATTAFRVYKNRVDDPQSAAGYTMDHTDIVYLMGKDGLFVDIFTHENTPAEMAARLKDHLKTGT